MARGVEKRRVNKKSRFVCWLLMLLQLGTAVGLILTIHYHLGSAVWRQNNAQSTISTTSCRMSTSSSSSLCAYGFVVGGVSFIWTILLAILLLFTCGCCGCGEWLEMFFAMIGVIWWAIPVAVFTYYGHQANRNKPTVPGQRWRWAAQIFSYIGFLLFAIHLVLALMRAARAAFNKGRASAHPGTDMEAGHGYNQKYGTQNNPQSQFITNPNAPGAPVGPTTA